MGTFFSGLSAEVSLSSGITLPIPDGTNYELINIHYTHTASAIETVYTVPAGKVLWLFGMSACDNDLILYDKTGSDMLVYLSPTSSNYESTLASGVPIMKLEATETLKVYSTINSRNGFWGVLETV